jgi:Family of unknown function (DUF6194)
MASPALPALEPEEVLSDLLGLDKAAKLWRQGVYRLAFCLNPRSVRRALRSAAAPSAQGGVVDLAGYDLTRLGELTPHPVYAWMRWVQILSPSRPRYESPKPLLAESLEAVKAKWTQRTAGRCLR